MQSIVCPQVETTLMGNHLALRFPINISYSPTNCIFSVNVMLDREQMPRQLSRVRIINLMSPALNCLQPLFLMILCTFKALVVINPAPILHPCLTLMMILFRSSSTGFEVLDCHLYQVLRINFINSHWRPQSLTSSIPPQLPTARIPPPVNHLIEPVTKKSKISTQRLLSPSSTTFKLVFILLQMHSWACHLSRSLTR